MKWHAPYTQHGLAPELKRFGSFDRHLQLKWYRPLGVSIIRIRSKGKRNTKLRLAWNGFY